VNTLQVVEAPSLLYMQLFNFTVAQFIVGSALFLVVTIPYLWDLHGQTQSEIYALAAGTFLFASVQFWVAGVAIYYRKLVREKLEAFCHASRLETMFIHALRSEIQDKATLGHRNNLNKHPEP
jgi:branched-subunit amino acid ABC-type transport system permease component